MTVASGKNLFQSSVNFIDCLTLKPFDQRFQVRPVSKQISKFFFNFPAIPCCFIKKLANFIETPANLLLLAGRLRLFKLHVLQQHSP